MTDKNTKKQLPGILRFLIKLFQIILYIPYSGKVFAKPLSLKAFGIHAD
jgi:hypothetical protein